MPPSVQGRARNFNQLFQGRCESDAAALISRGGMPNASRRQERDAAPRAEVSANFQSVCHRQHPRHTADLIRQDEVNCQKFMHRRWRPVSDALANDGSNADKVWCVMSEVFKILRGLIEAEKRQNNRLVIRDDGLELSFSNMCNIYRQDRVW